MFYYVVNVKKLTNDKKREAKWYAKEIWFSAVGRSRRAIFHLLKIAELHTVVMLGIFFTEIRIEESYQIRRTCRCGSDVALDGVECLLFMYKGEKTV